MSSSNLSSFIGRIKKSTASKNHFLIAALILAGLAALPLWVDSGLLNTRGGGDSPFLLQRVNQLAAALSDGHFPVRWMPDANYGYGYPFYNFYAPLSIYLTAAIRAVGFTYTWAIQLSQLAGFIVAAWAMFKLAKRWLGSSWAGLLASAAYSLAPFHMVNVYVRGDSLAEFWAMAFFPLLLLALDRLLRDTQGGLQADRLRSLALLALAFAALILSHNISALIFTPFVLLFLLLAIFEPRQTDIKGEPSESIPAESLADSSSANSESDQPEQSAISWRAVARRLLWPAAALLLGLILSAWFWLPALGDSSMAQLDPVTTGYFSFQNHFRDASLIQQSVIFNYDVAGGKAFGMGLIQIILIAAGLLSIIYVQLSPNRKHRHISAFNFIFIIAGLVISTFMITSISRFLWDNLPLLPFVQFPWRFLSIQAFFGALAVGGLALLPGRKIVVPIIIILLTAAGLLGLKLDFVPIYDQDVTAERLAGYEWFTGNIGTTVSAEYLPQSVIPRPFTSSWLITGDRDRVQVLDGVVSAAEVLERKAASQSWKLTVDSPQATITLPTLYWDGWSAEIEGREVSITPAPGSGLISIQLPAGTHLLNIALKRTGLRWAAELISLAGIFVLGLLFVRGRSGLGLGRRSWITLLIIVSFAIILWLLPKSEGSQSDLNWDFDQLAYLHHGQDDLVFDDGSILSSYRYSSNEITAGDAVSITLDWQELNSDEIILELVSPAANRFPDAPTIALARNLASSSTSAVKLFIPENAPSGPLLPRLTLDDASALTSSGQERGDLYLRPIQIVDSPEQIGDSDHSLFVQPVSVEARSPSLLDVKLTWGTLQPLSHNYNFSMRLVDANGIEINQFDNQPGYGFLPSSSWQPGYWVDDWLAMPISVSPTRSDIQPPYSLVIRLYDLATGEVVLLRHLGLLDWLGDELNFEMKGPTNQLPDTLSSSFADFENQFKLKGYLLHIDAEKLNLELYWQAAAEGLADYYRFVHLVDPLSGEIVAQSDAVPRNNSFPTSQWSFAEHVRDPVLLDLVEVPAGEYQIYVGLYRLVGDEVIPLAPRDETGNISSDGRFLLPDSAVIEP